MQISLKALRRRQLQKSLKALTRRQLQISLKQLRRRQMLNLQTKMIMARSLPKSADVLPGEESPMMHQAIKMMHADSPTPASQIRQDPNVSRVKVRDPNRQDPSVSRVKVRDPNRQDLSVNRVKVRSPIRQDPSALRMMDKRPTLRGISVRRIIMFPRRAMSLHTEYLR